MITVKQKFSAYIDLDNSSIHKWEAGWGLKPMCQTAPMRKSNASTRVSEAREEGQAFSLKQLADYVGFAPATVSLVLNRSAVANTISPETKKLHFRGSTKVCLPA